LSPAISSICASMTSVGASPRSLLGLLSLASAARAPTKSFWPARSQATT